MIKFGDLVKAGKATFKVNPITNAFGVIIFEDKMELSDKEYSIFINNKEYKLNVNPFNDNIRDVTLDTNQITEEQLKDSEVKIY